MHFYVHLVDTKFTKWSNFVREAWLIEEKWNKRSCLKPPMHADARRCSAPLIGVHRRFPILGGMRSARYYIIARDPHFRSSSPGRMYLRRSVLRVCQEII